MFIIGDIDHLTIDNITEEELRERAKGGGHWADYQSFSPIIKTALKHYCNKLITILNEEEIRKADELLRDDLTEHLRIAQNTLRDITPNNQELFESLYGNVIKSREIILNALSLYEKDIKYSKNIVAGELNNIECPNIEMEILSD